MILEYPTDTSLTLLSILLILLTALRTLLLILRLILRLILTGKVPGAPHFEVLESTQSYKLLPILILNTHTHTHTHTHTPTPLFPRCTTAGMTGRAGKAEMTGWRR